MSSLKPMLLAGLALLVVTCEKVPLTAPAGTGVFLQANPTFVVANGGTSVVTALLTEPAGTLVPDGTVVFFFTTLGYIDPEGKTRNGVAKVNFVADSRSGQATVTAWSGGPAPATSPSASSDAPATGTGSASITIDIGSKLPVNVVVTANPQVLSTARQALITANVFDQYGNPVQNVPVIFSFEDAAAPLQEYLDSGGSPRYTDSNGQAFDTLTTKTVNGTTTKTVTVAATVPVTGVSSTPVTVVVYYGTGR
jgi:hypothetical protein